MSTKTLVVAAIVGAGVLWGVFANRGTLAVRLFGPLQVALVETYGESDSELTLSHSTLDEQLQSQTEFVHAHRTWFQFEPAASTAKLTQLYNWYGSHFEQTDGSVLAFIEGNQMGQTSLFGLK
jgi:hypothetical protein